MDWSAALLITVGLLLVLLASGMRIAWALLVLGLIVLFLFMPANQALLIGHMAWISTRSFLLCAIPLFVFMSQILFRSGLAEVIYRSITPLLDHFPGGLLHSNIVSGAFLAAATGAAVASVATIGTVALPELEKRKYDPILSYGTILAGGALGNLIPPSVVMIIYGAMTDVSVGQLFIAGIFPGLLMASLHMGYTAIRVSLKPSLVPTRWAEGYVPWGKSLRGLYKIWPIILLVILVLGSIYAGVATPTEAAGVGCLGALVISAGYRRLHWGVVKQAATETLKMTGMIMFIFMGAKIMSTPLINMGVFYELTNYIAALPVLPIGILLAIYLMYLILGCFMSGLAAIVITLPIVYPIIVALGFDPVWFGVVTVILDEAGGFTPPVGMYMYVLQGLRPNTPFKDIVRGALQYLTMLMLGLAIITVAPPIATFLPRLMIGG